MKLQLLAIVISFISVNAWADLPIIACQMEQDKKIGQYQTQITVTSNYVAVVYYSKTVPNLGGYRATIYGKPEVKNDEVNFTGLTFNDGQDGWLNDMNLEITSDTVLFAEKGSKERPQKRAECWPRK